MTNVSAEYSKWATCEQAVCDFAQHVKTLRDTRAEAVRDAWHDPVAGAVTIARLDSEIASPGQDCALLELGVFQNLDC